MKNTLAPFIRAFMTAALTLLMAGPALAALKAGDAAPDFSARATLGGKEFDFSLADALKKGPVVLYFYPAAFTPGCTVEAHNFAEAMPEFQALGATVIGVSRDKIETLDKFSVEECRSAFPVAADATGAISSGYDAVMSSALNLALAHVLRHHAGRQDRLRLSCSRPGPSRRIRAEGGEGSQDGARGRAVGKPGG